MSDSRPHVVVVDVSAGADEGLAALRAAAVASLDLDQDVMVVGDENRLTGALAELAHDAERLRVVHAPDRLDPGELSQAVFRVARRSPIPVGLGLVASRTDASFVTAGPPGAVVHAARRLLGSVAGIRQPALAGVVPTLRHRGPHQDPFALLLDIGANARADTADLLGFARMGTAYARLISSNERPTLGILSHSRNPAALPHSLRQAHRALEAESADFEYIGLIGADRIPQGDADVVVTEGIVGNAVVRTLEGVAASAEALLVRAGERFRWRVGVSMLGGGIERLRTVTDWENYGGAPLLGVDRTVILTHEHAGEHALLNAIRLAAKVERLEVRAAIAG